MQHKLFHFHAHTMSWVYTWAEVVALLLAVFVFVVPAAADMRFQDRGLYMNSTVPDATTFYDVSWRYMSPQPVGSVDMLFCVDPIPYHPCVKPAGLDVSGAVLTDQAGETGFSISAQSDNHIVLTRAPSMIGSGMSSYRLEGIKNPTATDTSFSIRLRSHASLNATGPQIDFGSVKGQVTEGVELRTQVPPMLIFCMAEEVGPNCATTSEEYYAEMGQLSPTETLTAQSEMAVGTNASGGFTITANGGPPSAGTNVINGMSSPAESRPGTNQFGINLVANTAPNIGVDPEGEWANALAAPGYETPDMYKYQSGDVVAYSPNVSLMKKFTVSYILNSSSNLKPGVYSTTITYIATGQF